MPVAIINTIDKTYTDYFKLGIHKLYPELQPIVYNMYENTISLRDAYYDFVSKYDGPLVILTTLDSDGSTELDGYISFSERDVFFFSCTSQFMTNIKYGISLYNNDQSLQYLLATYFVDFDPYLIDIVHDNSGRGKRLSLLMQQLGLIDRYKTTDIQVTKFPNIPVNSNPDKARQGKSYIAIVIIKDLLLLDNAIAHLSHADLIVVCNDNMIKAYPKKVLACMGNALDTFTISQLNKNPILSLQNKDSTIRGPYESAYDCGLMYAKFVQNEALLSQANVLTYWDLILDSEDWAFITNNRIQDNVLEFARYDLMYTKDVVQILPTYTEHSLGDILSLPHSNSQLVSMIYDKSGVNIIPGTLITYIDRIHDKVFQKYSTSIIDLPYIQIGREFRVISPIVILNNGDITDVRMPITNEMEVYTVEILTDAELRKDRHNRVTIPNDNLKKSNDISNSKRNSSSNTSNNRINRIK